MSYNCNESCVVECRYISGNNTLKSEKVKFFSGGYSEVSEYEYTLTVEEKKNSKQVKTTICNACDYYNYVSKRKIVQCYNCVKCRENLNGYTGFLLINNKTKKIICLFQKP